MNLEKWARKIVVGPEDVEYAIRVLVGSNVPGETKKEILAQFKKELPELLGLIAIEIVGGAKLVGEERSEAFLEEVAMAFDSLVFPLLPLYSAASRSWGFIDEEKAVNLFNAALETSDEDFGEQAEKQVEKYEDRLTKLYGSLAPMVVKFFQTLTKKTHFFNQFVVRLFLVAITDALKVEVESVS